MRLGDEPLPYDLDGWKAYLEEMRTEPDSAWRQRMIETAEICIAALEANLKKTPVERP